MSPFMRLVASSCTGKRRHAPFGGTGCSPMNWTEHKESAIPLEHFSNQLLDFVDLP